MADITAWVEQHKALWARSFDEVIAPGLEEKWKKREQAYEKELKESVSPNFPIPC